MVNKLPSAESTKGRRKWDKILAKVDEKKACGCGKATKRRKEMIKMHNINFPIELQPKIKEFLVAKKVPISMEGIHFGNGCLINIPDKMIEEIKATFPKIEYRGAKTLLEESDLRDYKIGEKVTIAYLKTDFFPVINKKGTIHNVKERCLIVKKYRAKNKGWIISIGDNCEIKKGWR